MWKLLFVFWMITLTTMLYTKCILALEEIMLYTNDKNQSIRIQPFLNKSADIIQFNITCPHCNPDNDCKINIKRVFASCINQIPVDMTNKELIISLNSSNIFIPENKQDGFVVYPGCSYHFKSLENLKDINVSCNINNTMAIPPCVEGKCNCNKFNFNFVNMTPERNGDILTILADAEFENDLHVYTVQFELNCVETSNNFQKNYTFDDYHHIVIDAPLQGNHSSTYKQMCQSIFTYINYRNCTSSTYIVWPFDIPDNANALENITQSPENLQAGLYLGAVSSGILLIVIIVIVFKTRMRPADIDQYITRQIFPNELYSVNIENEKHSHIDQLECNSEEIKIIKYVGEGEFGNVFLAKSDRIYNEYGTVYRYIALKKMKVNATERSKIAFLREIAIMTMITDFAHVVRLLGCCTKAAPYMLITEYICSGDLKGYLIELRQLWQMKSESKLFTGEYLDINTKDSRERPSTPDSPSSSKDSDCNSAITKITELNPQSPLLEHEEKFDYQLEHELDNYELQNFALQIAKGMAHLETISIFHRDLAARNILVNECKVLKISDFGLSCIGEHDAIIKDGQQVPVRWTAPDVFDTRTYDAKSDVWSFAIVLWEIGMLGAYPYQDIENEDLINHLRDDNNRLERPPICSEALYEVMLRCWARDSTLRPSFRDLVDLLDSKRKRIYETFEFLNPTYIFPPTEEKD